jgi:hypothetical protein
MKMTIEEHLQIMHDFRTALHTLYPEKKLTVHMPKKEKGKNTES